MFLKFNLSFNSLFFASEGKHRNENVKSMTISFKTETRQAHLFAKSSGERTDYLPQNKTRANNDEHVLLAIRKR